MPCNAGLAGHLEPLGPPGEQDAGSKIPRSYLIPCCAVIAVTEWEDFLPCPCTRSHTRWLETPSCMGLALCWDDWPYHGHWSVQVDATQALSLDAFFRERR